ncbi:2TM domain-containing protein [Azospirillum sp. sgz302134]
MTQPDRSADTPTPQDTPEDAEKRRRLRAFLNHLIAYFAVMVVVVPVNALLAPGTPWFLFPLVAWGAPLAVHAAYVMGWWGRQTSSKTTNSKTTNSEAGHG